MIGYGGNDTYTVDTAADRVVEAVGGGADTVKALRSYTLGAGQEIEKLRASSAGSTTAMTLKGNEFANAIYGNAGVDTLDGGLGKDTLTGYGGRDTFLFDTALGAGNIDRIVDFAPTSASHDMIALSHAIFNAVASGPLSASAFKDIGTGAEDANDRILYNSANGALLYDADGSKAGGAAATQFATLSGHLTLTNADFKVV